MKVQVVISQIRKRVVSKSYSLPRDKMREAVFSVLTRHGISKEVALDCAIWIESAPCGDSYNEIDFDVYVDED